MYKKTLYIFILVLTCTVGFATANINTASTVESENSLCDCDTIPDPVITYVSDLETCVVTFTAQLTTSCVAPFSYNWSVDGGVFTSTGTSPNFPFETLDNIMSLTLHVNFAGSSPSDLCQKTAFLWLEDITCENSANEITLTKLAYNSPTATVPLDPITGILYETAYFEYRIEIRNNIMPERTESMTFTDVFSMENGYAEICEFTMLDPQSAIFHNGMFTGNYIDHLEGFNTPHPSPDSEQLEPQIISIAPGVTNITFKMYTSSGTCLSHNIFKNCAKVKSLVSGGFESESCAQISLRYGCPVGMSDGFCLDPEDLEAGDLVLSKMTGHTQFANIEKLTGRLFYDHTIFNTPDVILDPIIINDGFAMYTDPIAPGVIDFEVSSPNPSDTFNIGPGGTYSPLKVQAILINDLDTCTQFTMANITLTSGGTDQVIYVDPGKFCNVFPGTYDEAIIVIEQGAASCASVANPLTLNVVGPFDSQNPDTTYLWSTGAVTSSIDVSTGGTYFVNINDQLNCNRYAEITIDACSIDCECGSINPEIITVIDGCDVDATVNMPNCNNLESITYEWTFSNGNTYTGEFPPTQNFIGSSGGIGTVTLKIYYEIDGVYCEEIVSKNIFVACRGNGLKMYPNPANNSVQIELTGDKVETGTIRILNTQGMVVLESPFNLIGKSGPITCDVKSLSMGLYFVQLIDSEGSVVDIKRLAIK